jgi:DNA-binding CsgD family transcriptional regulator
MDGAWTLALHAAGTLAPHVDWRRRLAREVRLASDALFVSVMTCVPGSWLHQQSDADPPEYSDFIDQIASRFFPRIDRTGIGWRASIPRFGNVFAPTLSFSDTALIDDFRGTLLQPRDVNGYVVAFFLRPRDRMLVGSLALGTRGESNRLLADVQAPLERLTLVAGETLSYALDLAVGCGAVVPDRTEAFAKLTSREQQIAALVHEGLTDLNVSRRLLISEDTVGTHMRRIFRKLQVHSRGELIAALANPFTARVER